MDVERCFGVLQARFRIFRHESHYWDKRDVLGIYECRIILQNVVVCMSQNGMFQEDATGEVNLVTEFIEEDE